MPLNFNSAEYTESAEPGRERSDGDMMDVHISGHILTDETSRQQLRMCPFLEELSQSVPAFLGRYTGCASLHTNARRFDSATLAWMLLRGIEPRAWMLLRALEPRDRRYPEAQSSRRTGVSL